MLTLAGVSAWGAPFATSGIALTRPWVPDATPVPPTPLIHASIVKAGDAFRPAALPIVTWSSTPSSTRDRTLAALQVSVVQGFASSQEAPQTLQLSGSVLRLRLPARQCR